MEPNQIKRHSRDFEVLGDRFGAQDDALKVRSNRVFQQAIPKLEKSISSDHHHGCRVGKGVFTGNTVHGSLSLRFGDEILPEAGYLLRDLSETRRHKNEHPGQRDLLRMAFS